MPQQRPSPARNRRTSRHPPGTTAATVRLLAARAAAGSAKAASATEAPGLGAAEAAESTHSAREPRSPRRRRLAGGMRHRLAGRMRHRLALPVLLAALTIACGGLAAWFAASAGSLTSAPSAQNTALADVAATSKVTGQISSAINALFSYDYTAPGPTEAAARRWLTGPAIRQYASLFGQVRQEGAAKRLIVTTTVTNAGVSMLQGGHARVMIFAVETDRNSGGGQPASAGTLLAVNAVLQGGAWRIDGIDTY